MRLADRVDSDRRPAYDEREELTLLLDFLAVGTLALVVVIVAVGVLVTLI
jgi:hypothetical protein